MEHNPWLEGLSERVGRAKDAMLQIDPVDENDLSYLPNQQLSGQGLRNVYNALGELQPPPIDFGSGARWAPSLPAMGALKPGVPFERLREALAGVDPTELSPEAFSRYVKRLGPNIEESASALVGARDIDRYGTNNPSQIVARKWAEIPELNSSLIPPPKIQRGDIPPSFGAMAYYSPSEHSIALDPPVIQNNQRTGLARTPELQQLGVLGHETQHAIESNLYPNFRSRNELMGNSPSTFQDQINFRQLQEIVGAKPQATVQDLATLNQNYQSEVSSPFGWTTNNPSTEFIKDLFGRNPYGAQRMKSQGHFRDYNAFEFEYPQKTLSIENILKGGDVHPDIVKRYGLDPYYDQYKGGSQISNPWSKRYGL